ncbi:hypothetical protein [Phytoactinopolyspora halotolerans]|uniref:Uncharacterized protein n=1 Tax=Phytoactinopolyspora halotolerans TaxID=1981512 RepID=A0A6L9S934_9ACTN|nr:hypothetical protein [Phytoactinopolyspora halotolerans]NEE01201.1 hypothetical protein [Phytoactinopolyspora halotolerans]
MITDEPDEELFDHLVIEFLDRGRRAVEFLHAARQLLAMPPGSVTRQAALIGYCMREAMKAIPESQDVDGIGTWKTRSRAVVDAKHSFELIRGLPGEDEESALDNLLAKIDDMALTHEQDRVHQQRLIAVIVNRTGAEPLTRGTDPVRTYQDLIDRCDRAVHGAVTFEEAQQLWIDCMAVLHQLFLPPEVRHRELDALADLDSPDNDDAATVLSLVAGPNHLRRFLSRIKTVAWFSLLDESGVLEPPTSQAAWPVFAAVGALKDLDQAGLAAALQRMFDRWGADDRQAWYIARAAVDLGVHGRKLVLTALGRHPKTAGLVHLAIEAVRNADPADEFVTSVADIALNQTTGSVGLVEILTRPFINGVTAENYASRIHILCFKLRKVPLDDVNRHDLIRDRSGSIEEPRDHYQDDRFAILLRALLECLRRALDVVDATSVLDAIEPLPDGLADRVRVWLLGRATGIDRATLISEIGRAIAARPPTGDDLRLIERITSEGDVGDYVQEWAQVLPTPPTAAELGTVLAKRDVPREWIRVHHWSGLLPSEVTATWSSANAVLSGIYGEPSKVSLQRRRSVELSAGRSPLGEDEIRAMPVDEAARRIASWRQDPNDWLVSARELGRTLEAVVKAEPTPWASEPLKLVGLLHHPTYIHHYLRGLAASGNLVGLPIDKLFEAMALIRTRPWAAIPLGDDSFDFDGDWRGVEGALVDLIKSLAGSDVGFADRREEAWAILLTEVSRREEPSGIVEGASDALELAINRPCTRALEAVLVLMGHEFRVEQTVRPEALDLLASVLALTGSDGALHRAILAPRIGFLRHIAPNWVDQHREQLFGEAAPAELGQLTVDLALKWGQPNNWLLEQFTERIKDAVRRGVEHALDQYLIAMLRGVPGYGVQVAADFLSSINELSAAGENLGRLLRADDAPAPAVTVAIEFWSQVLAAKTAKDLVGFGWLSEVNMLDDAKWAELTLQTLMVSRGRIDWSHKVAERASNIPVTTTTLKILNQLVRGLTDEWDRRQAAEAAVDLLNKATELAETPECRRLRNTLLERGLI